MGDPSIHPKVDLQPIFDQPLCPKSAEGMTLGDEFSDSGMEFGIREIRLLIFIPDNRGP